jgi:hypothetical protein
MNPTTNPPPPQPNRTSESPARCWIPLLTGIRDGLWHAVERIVPPRPAPTLSTPARSTPARSAGPVQGVTLCGLAVQVAQDYDGFDRRRFDRTCPTCAWTHAVRTGTGTGTVAVAVAVAVAVEFAELAALSGSGPVSTSTSGELDLPVPHGAAARVAAAVLAAADADAPGSDYDRTHPATVQLLATVTAHAPTALLDADCAEGGCEHNSEPCPIAAVACPACSVRAGSWAGEWEGVYQRECTIPGPCEVLRTIAAHHHVDLVGPAQLRAGREDRR